MENTTSITEKNMLIFYGEKVKMYSQHTHKFTEKAKCGDLFMVILDRSSSPRPSFQR